MNEQKSKTMKVKTDIKAGQGCPFEQDDLDWRQSLCDESNEPWDKSCKLMNRYREEHPQCF